MPISEAASSLVTAVTMADNADVNPLFRANANMMRRELKKELQAASHETPNEVVMRVANKYDFSLTEKDVLEAATVLEAAVAAAKEHGLTLDDSNLWLSGCIISSANSTMRR